MFKDDPRAINEDGGRYYPKYSEPVMIGKKMTIEQAQAIHIRDAHMDYRKDTDHNNGYLDRQVKSAERYRLRKKLKEQGKL